MECSCEKVEKDECHWLRHPHFINGEYIEDCKLDEYRDCKKEEYVNCRCLRCKKEYQTLAFCIRDNKASCPFCIGEGVPV